MESLILSLVILAILGGFFYFVVYKLIFKTVFKVFNGAGSIFTLSKDEQNAFQKMMFSPNNQTVSEYIKVLKALADYATKTPFTKSIAVGDQMKYTNAYNVIKNSDSVSQELKDEMYRAFLVIGISVTK